MTVMYCHVDVWACEKFMVGVFSPHPDDCRKFLTCNSGVQSTTQCPGPLVFNPTSNSCDYSINVPCSAMHTQPPPETTTDEATTGKIPNVSKKEKERAWYKVTGKNKKKENVKDLNLIRIILKVQN